MNNSKISELNQFIYLLEKKEIIGVVIIIFLMLFAALLEMLSLAVLIPVFNLMFSQDLNKYKYLIDLQIYFNLTDYYLILSILSFILFSFIFKNFFLLFYNFKLFQLTNSIQVNISKKLFNNYLNQSYSFFFNKNSSFLIRNLTVEIERFANYITAVGILISEILIISFISVMLFFLNSKIFFFSAGIFLSFALLYNKFSKKYFYKWGRERQIGFASIVKNLRECFDSIKDVKLLDQNKIYFNKFNSSNYSYLRVNFKNNFFHNVPRLCIELLSIFLMVVTIFFITYNKYLIINYVPIFGIFVIAIFKFTPSINKIISASSVIRFNQVVVSTLYQELKNTEKKIVITNSVIQSFDSIKFSKVSFGYNKEKEILKDINILIKSRECLGFVGKNGSGKSTFIDLFSGLLQETSGSITVNNSFKIFNEKEWFLKIGYVQQNINLLEDTIKNNITFFSTNNNFDKKLFDWSVSLSHVDEFVNKLPGGYNSSVGEKGVMLSGGQKQRIAIARALYRNSEILILDEATSALDETVEKEVCDTIQSLKGKKTILIISHKKKILEKCDKIYKVDNQNILIASSS